MTEPSPKTTTDEQQDAAAAAVGALSPDATSAVVAKVVGNLNTTDQQQDAAAAAVGALSPDATNAVVAKVVGNLTTPGQQQDAAAAALGALPRAGQEEVLTSILGTPDPKTQRALWYIVISAIAAAIFVFGILTFVLILLGKSAEAPLALATTALGGIVGLLATTPGGRRQG
jgi:hypothetical protein